MKKFTMILAMVAVAVLATGAQSGFAATIVNDNFDDGVMAAQWVVMTASGGTVSETDGVVRCMANSAGGGARAIAGYETAANYTLSGDFSLQIDVDVTRCNGDYNYINFHIVTNATSGDNRSLFRLLPHTDYWEQVTYIYNANGTYAQTATRYGTGGWSNYNQGDRQLKMERVGSMLTLCARPLAGGTWTTLASSSVFTTDDVTSVQFYAEERAMDSDWYAIGADFDNFIVPEPATLVMLGLGGVGVLIRRRRRA